MRNTLAALLVATLVAAAAFSGGTFLYGTVEVITIDGMIDDDMVAKVKQQVDQVNRTPWARAAVLVVNSPGGGVFETEAVYDELSRLKVPAVGWCDRICASGAEFALMSPAVKFIAVRRMTISGSIGVIARMPPPQIEEGQVFKSGKFKQVGGGHPPSTDEERAYVQRVLVDQMAEIFYDVVGKARRNLTAKQWEDIKTARIFVGDAAVDAGLADAVMTLEQAIAAARELGRPA